ncbi:MAG: flippase-like domain-containing protein [Muribaculaceae bacterium]|nr:flippase-like domain-containing protein [Muribaculaceae bacterium]
MKPALKTTLQVFLPIAIGGTVAYWLFRKDFNAEALKSLEFNTSTLLGITLALLFFAGRELGLIMRFRSLTNNQLRISQATRVTFLCEFTSCITPTSVGGSAASMLFLNKEGIKLGQATTITFITLFFDELFIVIAAPFVFALISYKELFGFSASGDVAHDLQVGFWIVYGIIAAWALILWLGIFRAPNKVKWLIIKFFSLPILRRWKHSAEKTATDMVDTSKSLKDIKLSFWLKIMGWTSFSWVCRFLVVNALLLGLAGGVDQMIVFGRQLIVWVLLMFTPTPGGSGISEWIFKEYYGDMLSSGALIMVVALSWRVLTYYIYLAIGVFLLPSLTKRNKI